MTGLDECDFCRGTGWVTVVDYDGSGYEIACPEGCFTSPSPPRVPDHDAEVPF